MGDREPENIGLYSAIGSGVSENNFTPLILHFLVRLLTKFPYVLNCYT
jgi:hypothetical protein